VSYSIDADDVVLPFLGKKTYVYDGRMTEILQSKQKIKRTCGICGEKEQMYENLNTRKKGRSSRSYTEKRDK